MSTSMGLPPEVITYLAQVNPPEHPVLARCRAETNALGRIAVMQISAEQGALMAWFARLTKARRAIEVGVFTGYSSLARLQALSDDHFNCAPDEAGWAMVGTLEHYASLLKRITDSAFGEGEHAR